jgi:tetratricopeptide (TPR) repeat protein
MKAIRHIIRIFVTGLFAVAIVPVSAQYNCTILTDSSEARACRLYNASDSFAQGSPKCENYLDSAIAICPRFAPAWHERSVPFLKRGDFITWRHFLDKAVALDSSYLAYRGWCRFEFLRDYRGALQDLRRFDTLFGFPHLTSNNGDYELHIVMALCERELGHNQVSLAYFDKAFGTDSSQAGLYGYLHLGTTLLRTRDYRAAILALEHENRIYDKFAETWFYLAQANLGLGKKAQAKEQLLHAQALFNDHSGKYYLHDVYCEMPDAIYLSDVEASLAR